MKMYLQETETINYSHPSIISKAEELKGTDTEKTDLAKKCFTWVRDNIYHSADYKMNPLTLKASDVLKYKTGFCFAKSHLLTALLRYLEISAGLGYQRIKNSDLDGYYLHGITVIYLEEFGWFKVDPRGNRGARDNRPPFNAQFTHTTDALPYKADKKGEATFPEIWPDVIPIVKERLLKHDTYEDFLDDLPDIEIVG